MGGASRSPWTTGQGEEPEEWDLERDLERQVMRRSDRQVGRAEDAVWKS